MFARRAAFLAMIGLGCRAAPTTAAPRAAHAHAHAPALPGSALIHTPPVAPEPPSDPAGDAPAELEVLVHAKIVAKGGTAAKVLAVDVDPRFYIRVRITAVEPPTALLAPGLYDLAIHSPSRTFGGHAPPPGRELRMQLTIRPPPPTVAGAEAEYSGLRVE